jgi:hypothetical protein
MMETGAYIQALPFSTHHEQLNDSFYRNVRKDGLPV